jgi:hypothetical protein
MFMYVIAYVNKKLKLIAIFLLLIAFCSRADLLQSSTMTLIDSQYNTTSWSANNLLDNNTSTRWLSRSQTNDINFQLNSNGDLVCLSSFELTNYGNDDRSVKEFMLFTTSDSSLKADKGTIGWKPVIADANPTGKIDYLSWAQGARLVSVDSQYNSTSWAAANINDGSSTSRWLSSKSNNVIEYNFDTDWNGITGNAIPINEIEIVNYGNDDRSVKEFQVEVTTDGANWSKLEVPGTAAGDLEYIYSRRQDGGILDTVDSQYNATSWAASNMQDGDLNTRWLSRKGNNTLEFSFDPNNNGTTGLAGDNSDVFTFDKFNIVNYGNDDRSVNQFQIAVKTLANPTWQKISVPGAVIGQANYNFAMSHQGGRLVSINSQYNATSWAAANIHDGDNNTLWLSSYGNNSLTFQFDPDEDGITGTATDLFTLKSFYLRNYGVDDRSIKQFQIAVKTTADSNWHKLKVPGSVVGDSNFNFALSHNGGKLVAIDSQYNSTSWGADNIHDGDKNTIWLSGKGNNTLDFQFDPNEDGIFASTADMFKLESFYLENYGVDDRSIKQFQIEVKTQSNSNWVKLPVSGSTANTPGYNFSLAANGGSLSAIDSEYNSTSWGAKNIIDGDQNTIWLSSKQNNTLTFTFDTNNDGVSGDGINLDTLELVNYGNNDRSIQTFEIDIQIAGGAWQTVNAPAGGTVFTAAMDNTRQSWALASYSNVTAARIRTLSNYGDPSYTGASEIAFIGSSVGPSYTFTAAMHSDGETFTIDAANQPINVTDVRLRTINNYGDPYYIGAREFRLQGKSVTRNTNFIASMHANGETFVLDAADVPTNVTEVKLITISNYGDPYYIGAREFQLLGPSVTETKTFTAAMHGNGETFILDANDVPVDVTAVKLFTINNYGDPYYVGLKEFEVIGASVTPAHTFTVPMTATPYTILLDNDDWVSGIIGARLITIQNHGDPYYTGLSEFKLRGNAVTPSYIFTAQMDSTVQTFNFNSVAGNVFRFHSLNNHGDPYYIGATEFALNAGVCNSLEVHYDFNEGSGQTLIDSSGNGRNGTLGISTAAETEDPTWQCESTGFQLDFDNTKNQRFTVPAFAPPQEGAVAFWLKVPTLATSRNRIFGFGDGFEIRYESDGYLYFDINKSGSNSSIRTSSTISTTDTWTHFAIKTNVATGKWSIYKNGVLDNSGTETLTAQTSSVLTVGGSTWRATSESLNGSLEDFRIYSGDLSAAEIATLAANPPIKCNPVDHFEIVHDGAGITCAAEPVLVKACLDSSCSSLAVDPVTLDFTINNAVYSTPTFTGSTTINVSQLTPATLALSVANPSIVPPNQAMCKNGINTSCDLTFSNAGFRFLYGASNATTIPAQIAGNVFTDTVKIQAVKDNNGVCTGLFTGNVNVNLAQQNINPAGTSGLAFSVAGVDVAKYPTFSTTTLNFDTDSIATLNSPMYMDAGQIQLHASYDNGGISLAGSSNAFWVSPAKLIATAKVAGQYLNATTATSLPIQKAGVNFDFTINAVNSLGNTTPNYSAGQLQFSLARTGPTTGTNEGVFNYANGQYLATALSPAFQNVNVTAFSAGVSTYTQAQYSEVGLINLDIQDANYGGANIVISGDAINIGRFVPDHFVLATTFDGVLDGGNSFVYTGQKSETVPTEGVIKYAIEPEFTITAKSASGNTTLNYTDNFLRMTEADIVRLLPTTDSVQLGADLVNKVKLTSNLNTGTFSGANGVINYKFNLADNFFYNRELNSIIAPFTAQIPLQITSITDADGISANDIDTDNSNGVLVLNPSGVDIRFGRLFVDNAFAPETSALPMPMRVQYWDGVKFVTNIDDSFTTFNATNSIITDINLAPATTSALGSGLFSLGETNNLILSSPGLNNQGAVNFQYTAPSWLQYDWQNSDNNFDGPYTDNPSAVATFGVFRGNDRVIYWREVSN